MLALAGAVVAGGAGAAVAAPVTRDAIIRSCVSQMFLSQPACACLAEEAGRELDPLQQAWLALGATDVAESAPISKRMTAAELREVDRFMRTVPDQCTAMQASR